jgi:non-ribosomal peptide synthetase component F
LSQTIPPNTGASAPPQPHQAPGTVFNIAAHLLQRNQERPEKLAFVDDQGSLTYGALSEQGRRLAAGLLAAGVRPVLVFDGGRLPAKAAEEGTRQR